MSNAHSLRDPIRDVDMLEDLLSTPSEPVVESMSRLQGDIIVLGAGGKMGPSLARLALRASMVSAGTRRIIAVSRFRKLSALQRLRSVGVEAIQGDLLDPDFLNRLPAAANVVFMTGVKFGTAQDPALTWAMNTYLPSLVCQQFAGSRMLVFSTGNVYPFVPPQAAWSRETDELRPVGEYGMSALGRERIFEYFSRRNAIPVTIVRLNYAVEMRYGVVLDLARKVACGQTIDLSMGYANVIWQADANALALCALADAAAPPFVMNVAGPELLDVQRTCVELGERLGRAPHFSGAASDTALLNDGGTAHRRYQPPTVPLYQIVEWTADWIQRRQPVWDQPTHFEVRNGAF